MKYQTSKTNNILYIDSSNNKMIIIKLTINGQSDEQVCEPDTRRNSQVILQEIDKILLKHHMVITDVSKILVNRGPGSFTGIRVGVTIANTLGFMLKLPINNKKVGEFIKPIYT